MSTTTRPGISVKDVMTSDPVSVDATTSPRDLARIFADNDFSGVPVTDAQDRVIGVVSKTDLLRWCAVGGRAERPELFFNLLDDEQNAEIEVEFEIEEGAVEDFMSNDPVLATADEPVASIARRMLEHKVHRIIVVDDDGCLVGVVTSFDVLKVVGG